MVNGGVLLAFKTSSWVTSISMSPVGIWAFLDSRILTSPVALMTNSRPSLRALKQRASFESMLKANWVRP